MCDRYKQFFVEADTDHDDQLTLEELTVAIKRRGYTGSDTKIKAMFDSVDDSGDRLISLDEYLWAMGQLPENDHTVATMRRIFREFDKNGDGEIDKRELEHVLRKMRDWVPQKELDRIMAAADRDGNQKINYEEFIKRLFL